MLHALEFLPLLRHVIVARGADQGALSRMTNRDHRRAGQDRCWAGGLPAKSVWLDTGDFECYGRGM